MGIHPRTLSERYPINTNITGLRAIPFECTWGGVERSPIKKSWGEGVKMKELGVYMKKNHGGGSEIVSVPPPPPMYIQME